MKHYPEYKNSGVEWIGEIPKHWTMTRLKYLGESIIGLSYKPEDVTDEESGTLVLRASNIQNGKPLFLDNVYVNVEVDEKLRLKEGDILICSRSGSRALIGKNITITKELEGLTFGVFMTVFRTKFFSFISYFLNSQVFKNQSGLFPTTTINQLTIDTLNNFFICFPRDEREQAQIAAFLDRKTQQIDELIHIKERLIELLQEKRTVLINQAVTKGLDLNVEMKPSGVEWIGEIPKHWEIKKIKHIATLVSEKSIPEIDAIKISPENVESETGKVLDFYSPYDSTGVKFQAGDVLFNKLRVYLSKVVFAEYSGYSLGEMIVVRPSLQGLGKHLFYLMLSCRFIEYCNSISYGVKMPRTDVDNILNAQIPMTSYQEQVQIAAFLDRKTQQIDELLSAEQRKVELLKEYRQSLISEVVTGKIDVRNEV